MLVTLMATASIGMSASRVVKDKAEARTGQRLRTKLRQTSTQKWTNFSKRERLACKVSNSSLRLPNVPDRIRIRRASDLLAIGLGQR